MKLFKKSKSRFYWFDFTVRGRRYRGSTGETKAVRATKVSSMKLVQALEHGDLIPTKSRVLAEFSQRFLSWLDEARLEEKTRKYYRNGCRLLEVTPLAQLGFAFSQPYYCEVVQIDGGAIYKGTEARATIGGNESLNHRPNSSFSFSTAENSFSHFGHFMCSKSIRIC